MKLSQHVVHNAHLIVHKNRILEQELSGTTLMGMRGNRALTRAGWLCGVLYCGACTTTVASFKLATPAAGPVSFSMRRG